MKGSSSPFQTSNGGPAAEFFLNARLESVKATPDALEMIELKAGRIVAPR